MRCVDVTCIVLAGRVEVTRAALDLALSRKIPLFLETSNGRLRGSVLPPICAKAGLRVRQYAVLDDEGDCMKLARACLSAQIKNQRAILRRFALRRTDKDELERARAKLKELQGEVPETSSIEALRGIEGVASRNVFDGVRCIVDPSLGFTARSVRSGKDAFNVVLDILGGLLAATCGGAVESAGLDPYKGVFHGSSRNAPALALDLEDVFRPILVTATALTVFTKDVLSQGDFVLRGGKCRIGKDGVTKVCRAFGKGLHRPATRIGMRTPHDYLHHIHEDAQSIAAWVDDPTGALPLFTVR